MTQRAAAVTLAWLAFIGFDFLFHGGIIAFLHARPNPAILPAEQLFYRIGYGYFSFLLMVVMLYWLMERLQIVGTKSGLVFGLQIGALLGVAWAVAFYSYLTLPADLLVAIAIGQCIEMAISGAVIGAVNAGCRLRWVAASVAAGIALAFVITVVLQSTELAPLPQ